MPRPVPPPTLRADHAAAFVAQCEALDVAPPAVLVHGLKLLEVAQAFASQPPAVELLTIDPARIGRLLLDWSTREHKSARTMAGDGLSAGVERFEEQLLAEMRQAVIPDLDRVITDLRPRFDQLTAPLTTAAQQYNFTLATTADDVINRSADAIAAWRDLRHAGVNLGPITGLWQDMIDTFGVGPTRDLLPASERDNSQYRVNLSVCFAESGSWSLGSEYATDRYRSHVDWLAIAASGLRLNTPSEVAAKLTERQRQQHNGLMPASAASTLTTFAETAPAVAGKFSA